MKINYSKLSKEQLHLIKEHISFDSKILAIKYLEKLKSKIELLADFPYLGKINQTFNEENIRDYVIDGYKVIYYIDEDIIHILAIYKHINFDEKILKKYFTIP